MCADSNTSKKRVCYFYDQEIGNYYYGQGHPMKPHRIRMTHNLIVNYGLYQYMHIYRPRRVTEKEMTMFHSDDYINFLRMVTDPSNNSSNYQKQMYKFNVGEDCPVFDGLYQFCQISAGGSVGGAIQLNQKECDIALNWGGGLHHAKKSEASGFCYVNDIVLAILELLKYHARVLYIDIDIHHGDGVEEAFYTTDRVMCVSFHKFGEYFPGTGHIRDIGVGKGKYYSVNFPLRDGIDDESYDSIFKPVISKVIEFYQPEAIVMQCGSDSLSGDRLGCFNLSIKGHGACVEFVKSFNIPMLVLGGGGYTIRNVARCWSYETAICLDKSVPDELPYNDYFEYYGPEYRLHITPTNMENLNTEEYLESCKIALIENLRHLIHAPSVQFHNTPKGLSVQKEKEKDPEVRISESERDRRIANPTEFSDSEDEGDNRRDMMIDDDEQQQPHSKPPIRANNIPEIKEIFTSPEHNQWSEMQRGKTANAPPLSAGAVSQSSPIRVVPINSHLMSPTSSSEETVTTTKTAEQSITSPPMTTPPAPPAPTTTPNQSQPLVEQPNQPNPESASSSQTNQITKETETEPETDITMSEA